MSPGALVPDGQWFPARNKFITIPPRLLWILRHMIVIRETKARSRVYDIENYDAWKIIGFCPAILRTWKVSECVSKLIYSRFSLARGDSFTRTSRSVTRTRERRFFLRTDAKFRFRRVAAACARLFRADNQTRLVENAIIECSSLALDIRTPVCVYNCV